MGDVACRVSATQVLGYESEAGGSVARFNALHDTALGEWEAQIPSYIARDEVSRNNNGIFCPTLSQTEVYDDAPSAAMLSIGNRDDDQISENAIRIVRYMGLQSLPDGQLWGFPLNDSRYPFAAFHYPYEMCESDGAAIVGEEYAAGPDSSFTLCFEERDGVEGLHTYYERQRKVEAEGRALCMAIRIAPHELLALQELDIEGPDIRSLYRFTFEGQTIRCRLHAVEGYDVEREVATMLFVEER